MTRRKRHEYTDEELQDPDMWDWEHAEVHPPVKNFRVVLSVSFPGPDFDKVAECAEQMGKKLSEFVREAALERVARENGAASFAPAGTGAGAVIAEGKAPSATRASGKVKGKTGDVDLQAD